MTCRRISHVKLKVTSCSGNYSSLCDDDDDDDDDDNSVSHAVISQLKQVATVMIATGSNAIAAQIRCIRQTAPTSCIPSDANGILIGSAVLHGSPVRRTRRQTDTHTDHATPSAAVSRIYAMHAMRPKRSVKCTQWKSPMTCTRVGGLRAFSRWQHNVATTVLTSCDGFTRKFLCSCAVQVNPQSNQFTRHLSSKKCHKMQPWLSRWQNS